MCYVSGTSQSIAYTLFPWFASYVLLPGIDWDMQRRWTPNRKIYSPSMASGESVGTLTFVIFTPYTSLTVALLSILARVGQVGDILFYANKTSSKARYGKISTWQLGSSLVRLQPVWLQLNG